MKRKDLRLQLGDVVILFNEQESHVRKLDVGDTQFPIEIGCLWYTRNGLYCNGDRNPEFTVMKVNGVEIIDEVAI